MRKYILVSTVFLLAACKKSSNSSTPATSIASFYGAVSDGSVGQPYTFDNLSTLSCVYNASLNAVNPVTQIYNGPYFQFNFSEIAVSATNYPLDYIVTFVIPADSSNNNGFSINQTIQYKYTPTNYYQQLLNFNKLTFSASQIYAAADSAVLSVTITRYSNTTVDGTFSMTVYPAGSTYAQAKSGVFTSIKVLSP